ncbi:MAG: DUF4197 domain-containing protein [Bacteroidota bacterium]
MKTLKIIVVLSLIAILCNTNLSGQVNLKNISKNANSAVNAAVGNKSLTNDDVVKGLKEALTVGSTNSVKRTSVPNGFYNNPKIKIPFPAEYNNIKTTVTNLGMKSTVDKFEKVLNNAAEEASKQATPIFTNAITKMNINDGMTILKGKDDEATQYLKKNTSVELKSKFKPVVQSATQKVELLKYWKPIMDKYNSVSKVFGAKKVNPDLDAYVTDKAIEGLFKLVAEEETKIRKDPMARVSDILKKVFAK